MQQNREARTLIAISTLVIAVFLLVNLIVDAAALPDWAPLLTFALFLIAFGFIAWLWVDSRRMVDEVDLTQGADTGSQLSFPQAQEWILPTAADTAIPAKTEATDEAAVEIATPHAYQETDEAVEEAKEKFMSEEGSLARDIMDTGPDPAEAAAEVIEVDPEHFEDSVMQSDVAEETLVKELPVEETTVVNEPAQEDVLEDAPEAENVEGVSTAAAVDEPVVEEVVVEEVIVEEPAAPVDEPMVIDEPVSVEEEPVTAEPETVQEEPAVTGVVVTRAEEPDNLTVIEGIGPHYRDLLAGVGITTFAGLAALDEDALRAALLKAGASRIPKSIETWVEQAAYAAREDWDGLATFQSSLNAGRRRL